MPTDGPPATVDSYAEHERVYVAVHHSLIGWFRAEGTVIRKIDDENYRVRFLVQIMMQEPCCHDFHVDHIAKWDNPDKWR